MTGRALAELLFPPKCVGCGARLEIFDNNPGAFCDNCRADWETDKQSACPTCRVAANECTCAPAALDKKHIHCISLVKFGRTECVDRLIYSIKKRRITRSFDFAADELAVRLDAFRKTSDLDLADAIVTHVPRKRASIVEHGFDHAQILARMTAEKSGYKYESLIRRVRGGKDQKKLTSKERGKNVKGSFEPSFVGEPMPSVVILVDDVVTTGSTAEECIKSLRAVGVKNVVLLSIARASEQKKAKRKRRMSKKSKKD